MKQYFSFYVPENLENLKQSDLKADPSQANLMQNFLEMQKNRRDSGNLPKELKKSHAQGKIMALKRKGKQLIK